MKKKIIYLITFIALLAAAAVAVAIINKDETTGDYPDSCASQSRTMNGECLPEGLCVGATDGVVKCSELNN